MTVYTRGLTDQPIRFPGLFGDFAFSIDPVAISIGHGIYWYGILIGLGVLLATFFCAKEAKRYGLTEDTLYDAVLYGVPMAIVGARAYYVLFYRELYYNADGSFNWADAIAVWDGGLAVYGGLLAGLLVGWLYSKKKGFPFWVLTDVVVMGFFIGQSIGRWGNFVNREAFGNPTTLPWRMEIAVAETLGQVQTIEVHPTFLYESLWNLMGFLLLYCFLSRRRKFDGQNTCFYFIWYGTGRFWIEQLRTDSLYLFDWTLFGEPIRVSQALSVLMVGIATAVWIRQAKKREHKPLYKEQQ